MPLIGFGTWDLQGEPVKESLRVALDKGYNHIDTAEGYRNEAEIGEVLKSYNRDRLFLTSKVLPTNLHYDDVLGSLDQSLDKLGTDYLDLYLIHWPNPAISLRETLLALSKLYESGLVKTIGVSNFSKYQLRVAHKISDVPISVNQVEFHPWNREQDLLEYCESNDITMTASAPLARTKVLQDPVINELSEKYQKTPAQIVLEWQIKQDVVTIPKSSSKDHIESNFEAVNFELEESDVDRINNISKQEKVYQLDLEDDIYGIPS
ncbi:MAG: aldo/keto reductase [Candidatus Bipolaricaulota bacterium]